MEHLRRPQHAVWHDGCTLRCGRGMAHPRSRAPAVSCSLLILLACFVLALHDQLAAATTDGGAAAAATATRAGSGPVQCSPLANDTAIGQGDSCGSVHTATAAECCAACTKSPCCVAFTFTTGRTTCYLKSDATGRRPDPGRVSGTVARPPRPPRPPSEMAVTLSPDGVVNTVSPLYASFALDTSENRGWFVRSLRDPRLIKITSALSPAVLRVGGSGGNCLRYNVPATAAKSCEDSAPCCVNQSTWDDLNALAAAANASLVFGLRATKGGPANDTLSLLRYTASNGYKVHGWEWGNEVGCGTGDSLRALGAAVNATWADPDERPRLVGPDAIQFDVKDANATDACAASFFNGTAGAPVLAFTYHLYLQTHSPVYTADELDLVGRVGVPVRDAVARLGSTSISAEVWMGEMGGHSGGGVKGVTDVFASHQWYLDSMGLLATLGHSLYVRQDLVGGNYGLVRDNFPFGSWAPTPANSGGGAGGGGGAPPPPPGWQRNNTYTVLPDFWALVLWQRVMGTRVLSARVANTTGDASTLRAYAHCSKGADAAPGAGAATLLLINIDAGAAVDVDLPAHDDGAGGATVYAMTAPGGNVTSPECQLNGETLAVAPDGTVPPVRGRRAEGLRTVTVAPQSYTFVVLPGAAKEACA